MNTTLANSAPDSPRSDAAPAARRPGEILLTLVRRELWEHRALWLAPLVVAVLLAVVAAIGRVHIELDKAPDLSRMPRASAAGRSRWRCPRSSSGYSRCRSTS